jgi:hypothetical protein
MWFTVREGFSRLPKGSGRYGGSFVKLKQHDPALTKVIGLQTRASLFVLIWQIANHVEDIFTLGL